VKRLVAASSKQTANPTIKTCKADEMATVSDYYRIVSVKGRVLHAELKRSWSDKVMDQFSAEIQAMFTKAVKSFGGKRFILLADWSDSPIFGPKAEIHLAESMRIFKENNGYKVVEVVPATLVKIGLKNAAARTGEDDFRIVVTSLAKAWEVIKRLEQDLQHME
jgi:hypothetical protein